MPRGTEVGLGLGDIVLDGDPAPQMGHSSPHFSTHVYCSQTAEWIKMELGMQIGVGQGHIVLHGDQLPLPKRGTGTAPNFGLMSVMAKRLDGRRCHLVQRYAAAQATLC